MTFEEFMKLERGDGVIIDGHVGTVTDVTEHSQGSVLYDGGTKATVLHSLRELEVSFVNKNTGKFEKLFPVIYTDFSGEAHNRSVLERLRVWNPFQ